VIGGAVLKHSQDFNLVRESVARQRIGTRNTRTRYPTRVRYSLEAAILIGTKIALGQIDSGIACGVDSASDVPVVYPDS